MLKCLKCLWKVYSISECAWLLVLSAHLGSEVQGGSWADEGGCFITNTPGAGIKRPFLLPLNPLAKAIELCRGELDNTIQTLFPVPTWIHKIERAFIFWQIYVDHVGFGLLLLFLHCACYPFLLNDKKGCRFVQECHPEAKWNHTVRAHVPSQCSCITL